MPDLTIKIAVDNREAKAELAATDKGLEKIATTANSTGSALSDYDRQVQSVVKSKQVLTTTSLATVDSLNATREAVQLNSVAVQDLFTWVDQGGKGWSQYADMARNAWNVLRGLSFADVRNGLNAIGESAGLTFTNLGLLGSAGAAMGAGYAGWGVGRMIADFFGLDNAIAKATARLIGFGDVAGQEAGAKADVLALATRRAGREITDFTEALKVNTEWVQNNNARARELNDVLARLDAPRQFAEQVASWRAEIQLLTDAGVLGALKAGLESNLISVKELADSYHISVGAVQMYKAELHEEAEAHKQSEAAAAKHRAEQERLQAQFDKETATLAHWTANMELAASSTDRLVHNLRGLGAELPKMNALSSSAFGASFQGWAGVGTQRLSGIGSLMPDMGTGGFGMTGGGSGGNFLTDMLGSLKSKLDPKTILNSAIGGGLSGLVSTGIGLLTSGIAKLFANPEKQINPIREAFVQAAGGLAKLNERAHEAGITLDHLLNAKNPEQYKAAIDELNAAFQFQDTAMQSVKATAEKYGLTLAEMGPKFRQSQLDEQLLTLYQDQRVLSAAGVDYDLILQKQASSFQDLITVALQTGATIPSQLQPAVQRLIDMGLVTDLTGEKLTDIGKLTFAETLDAKFTTLIATIEKLANAISTSLGTAIANIPDRTVHIGFAVDPAPDLGFRGENSAERMHTGGVVLPFMIRAHRGLAIDEVPIIAQRGEGILNRQAMQRMGGANALNRLNAGGGASVSVAINGLTLERGMDEHDAEELIGKAVVSAIRKRGIRIA